MDKAITVYKNPTTGGMVAVCVSDNVAFGVTAKEAAQYPIVENADFYRFWNDAAVQRAAGGRAANVAGRETQYAIVLPALKNSCMLPDGRQVSLEDAKAGGFEITNAFHMALRLGYVGGAASATAAEIQRNLAAASHSQKSLAYAAAVMNLPEAQERPNAAAMIGTAYAESWTVERARSFLRGLPKEVADDSGERSAERRHRTPADDAKLHRKAELRLAVLTRRIAHGDTAQELRVERQALKYALECVQHGSGIAEALHAAEIDPDTLDETIKG